MVFWDDGKMSQCPSERLICLRGGGGGTTADWPWLKSVLEQLQLFQLKGWGSSSC